MKSILLIGLGRYGRHVAMKLNEIGHDVMAVDHNEEKINRPTKIKTTRFIAFPNIENQFF